MPLLPACRIGHGEDDGETGDLARSDELLGAVEHEVVAVAARRACGSPRRRSRASARSGEGAEHLARASAGRKRSSARRCRTSGSAGRPANCAPRRWSTARRRRRRSRSSPARRTRSRRRRRRIPPARACRAGRARPARQAARVGTRASRSRAAAPGASCALREVAHRLADHALALGQQRASPGWPWPWPWPRPSLAWPGPGPGPGQVPMPDAAVVAALVVDLQDPDGPRHRRSPPDACRRRPAGRARRSRRCGSVRPAWAAGRRSGCGSGPVVDCASSSGT